MRLRCKADLSSLQRPRRLAAITFELERRLARKIRTDKRRTPRNFSTWTTTRSAYPRNDSPSAASRGYTSSPVMSRINATFLPSFTICANAERPAQHAHVQMHPGEDHVLDAAAAGARFQVSCPLSVIASPGSISIVEICRVHASRIWHFAPCTSATHVGIIDRQVRLALRVGPTPGRAPALVRGQRHWRCGRTARLGQVFVAACHRRTPSRCSARG